MEPKYKLVDNFEIDVDSIRVENLVICPCKASAELVQEKIFFHFNDFYLISVDGSFPQSDLLKDRLNEELRTNSDLKIVFLNSEDFALVKPVSRRLLFLDRFIIHTYSGWNAQAGFRRDWRELDIVSMIMCFFEQWDVLQRDGNYSENYRSSPAYNQKQMGWILDLISKSQ